MKAAVLLAVGAPLVVEDIPVPEIVALAAAGLIRVTQPICRRYGLDQADEAYRTLDRGHITGRAIVVM